MIRNRQPDDLFPGAGKKFNSEGVSHGLIEGRGLSPPVSLSLFREISPRVRDPFISVAFVGATYRYRSATSPLVLRCYSLRVRASICSRP